MKVLIVGPLSSPIIRRVRQGLISQGVDVYIASHNVEADDKIISLGALKNYFSYLEFFKIKKIIDEIKPDVVHAHIVNHYGLMCLLSPVPVVLALWGSEIMIDPYQGGYFRKKIFRVINYLGLKKAAICHTSSQHILEQASIQCLGVEEKSKVFYWGLPLNKISDSLYQEVERNLRTEFNISKEKLLIFPRGLGWVYNPSFVSELINKLYEYSDFNFKIVVLCGFANRDEISHFKSLIIKCKGVVIVERVLSDEELYVLYSKSQFHFSVPISDALGGGVIEPAILGSIPILSDLPSYNAFARKHGAYIIKDSSNESISSLYDFLYKEHNINDYNYDEYVGDAVLGEIISCYQLALNNNEV